MIKFASSFQSITLTDGTEYACNKEGEGLFRRDRSGAWQQLTGTCQTPTFKTAAQFSLWLRRDGDGVAHMVRGSAVGWEVQS